jgi:hypothetical protein
VLLGWSRSRIAVSDGWLACWADHSFFAFLSKDYLWSFEFCETLINCYRSMIRDGTVPSPLLVLPRPHSATSCPADGLRGPADLSPPRSMRCEWLAHDRVPFDVVSIR